MAAYFGEKKELDHKQYAIIPAQGNFALETTDLEKQVQWDYCREKFAAKFVDTDVQGFLFSHPEKRGKDVANFLHKFETIVGFSQPVSYFSETNKDTILWIGISPFWLPCMMRRSLLTILLRCGMCYNTECDNFDDALFGDHKDNIYARETKSAILRFMFGFTEFTGKKQIDVFHMSVIKHGWREEFQKIDDSNIRRLLVLPEGSVKETSIVGLESLWV